MLALDYPVFNVNGGRVTIVVMVNFPVGGPLPPNANVASDPRF